MELMLMAALALLGGALWIHAEARAAILVEDSHTMFRPKPTSQVSGRSRCVPGSVPLRRTGSA